MYDLSLSASIDRFLAWCEANRKPATVYGYRLYLRRFLSWAGNVQLDEISPARLSTWSQKFHPTQAVQRLLAWCHKEERSIARNPLEGMRKVPTGARSRTLPRCDVCRMLRAVDPSFRVFLLALRETFARPQEMRSVRCIDIRRAGGELATAAELIAGFAFFDLGEGKGWSRRRDRSSMRIIPISCRLGRAIARIRRRKATIDDLCFLNSKGRPWTANAVRCRLRRLRELLALGRDRRGERVVAYTLRHTGATAAARAGLRDWTLAAVLGHSSTRTTDRYVHLQADDVIQGMQRVWKQIAADRPKKDRPGSTRNRPD